MASSSGKENNQDMVDSEIIPRKYTFGGILDILKKQRNYVEPPYIGPHPPYSCGPKPQRPVSDTDDPKVKGNVGNDRKRASEMPSEDETIEFPARKKSRTGDEDSLLRLLRTYEDRRVSESERIACRMKYQADKLAAQKLEEGLRKKQSNYVEPPYFGPQPPYSSGPKPQSNVEEDPDSDTDDPKIKGNVGNALEMPTEDETIEFRARKKSRTGE